jgi:hypothetical protein
MVKRPLRRLLYDSLSVVFIYHSLGSRHESAGIGKKDMPQLQDRSPQGRGARHLQGPAPQAATGLSVLA